MAGRRLSRLAPLLARAARFVVDRYATVDPRSLGVLRIALGALLFLDVARRWPDVEAHYANTGWLTNHFSLFAPMSSHLFSLYLPFSTPAEVKCFMLVHLAVNLALMVGWRTRLMHVLAALLLVSLNSRNPLLENGGWVVLTLLTVWTMFLPLGRRFSVDALLRPGPPDTRPVRSLAVTALLLQWIVIYAFNVVHKTAPPWRDGTAVYYLLQQDHMVTALGAWVRGWIPLPLVQALTFGTLGIESAIALLLALPFRTHVTRMLAWALVIALHFSIDLLVQLGPFSWAMIVMLCAFIPRQAWARIEADGPPLWRPWRLRERIIAWAGQLAVAVLIVCSASQVLLENAAVPRPLKVTSRPDWMTAVVMYPRLFQGWSMFAPGPPMDDGRVVVDGRTRDGRKLDPLTGQPPSFAAHLPGGWRMNQIWGDFHRRIADGGRWGGYWDGVREFLRNHHRLTGRPEDELVAFDVWFVIQAVPPPGAPWPAPERRKMLSYGAVTESAVAGRF